MPTLSIIIVNYNAKGYLRECLGSLYSERQGPPFETIVVDNCSRDGSLGMVATEFPQVRLLAQTENLGFARGNNVGIAAAAGEYLLLLNSDTRILGDALSRLTVYLDAHPDVAVAAPRLVYPDLTDQNVARAFPTPMNALFGRKTLLTRLFPNNRYSRSYLLSREHASLEPFEVDWVSGACLLVKRSVLDETGPFDDSFFMYWEDLELCYRIKLRGWKVCCLPEARVVHYEGKSTDHAISNRCIIAFNRGAYRYYRKHHISSSLDIMNVAAILGLSLRTMVLLGLNTMKNLARKLNGGKKPFQRTVSMKP